MSSSTSETLHTVKNKFSSRIVDFVNDFSISQKDHAVGVSSSDGIVGDHHDGLVQVGDGVLHECQNFGTSFAVKVSGWFVSKNDLRATG
jgi:hypothetical protein